LRARRRIWAALTDLFTAVPAGPTAAPAAADPGSDSTYGTRLGSHLLSRPGRLVVACLATVLGPAVVAQAGAIDTRTAAGATAIDGSNGPVPVPIPGDRASWLPLARSAAATCPGLPAAVLVAIAHLESNLGQQDGASAAGAVGPMQFLPSTWAAYGADGDGDGLRDVMNPVDAVHGAARLLCANGGADADQLPSALWSYNHSDVYVAQVLGLAHLLPVSD
jgi:soluble lytic murein transglycosylase-like protein